MFTLLPIIFTKVFIKVVFTDGAFADCDLNLREVVDNIQTHLVGRAHPCQGDVGELRGVEPARCEPPTNTAFVYPIKLRLYIRK